MTAILRTRMLSRFTCLGDKCSDTCCQGWSMQMDEVTLQRYRDEKPELLDVVEPAQDGSPIMRKDPNTGFCVKLEGGLCGIHKQFGERFLGDACYFYPRATRVLGAEPIMTAVPSCPEITRLMLESDDAFELEEAEAPRLPNSLKSYLPEGLTPEGALSVHQAFLAACDDTAPVETIFARIMSVSRSIELIDKATWPQAVPFYLKNADMRLPVPEMNPADPFNLLHALCGLIVASKKKMSERLSHTVAEMEQALQVTLDWQQVLIYTNANSNEAYQAMRALWEKEGAAYYAPILKRWLKAQLLMALYPFAGLGGNLTERSTIIGVRLATVKLALMSACVRNGVALPQEEVIRIIQSLARFLDHLGDPSFSVQIYNETGWNRETRLRGLLNG